MATINGTNNNDTLANTLGNDVIDGQAGVDTAVYQAANADVQISRDANGQLQIRDLNSADGDEGIDTLTALERVQFRDSTWQLIGETRVNTTTANFQLAPAITKLGNGGYMVAWQSNIQDGSGLGIYAQRFDAMGQAVGGEFRINTYTRDDQNLASLTTLADGSVMAVWQSIQGADTGVYAQRIGADGSLIGAEFLVNSANLEIQSRPSVTALADGGFVVAWESNLQDGSGYGIYAQRYDAAGGLVGGESRINTVTAFDQTRVSSTALNDGGYLLVWQSNRQDGSGFGVYGQRYDAMGQAVGSEFLVNTTTANSQQLASVAALTDGGFVVTWQSNLQDGSGFGIYAQRYDAAGSRMGVETLVNSNTASDQRAPRILALASGGYVVVWQSDLQDGSAGGVFGQVFAADGTALGAEFVVNTTTTDEQVAPALTALADGGFVVTWQSNLQDGSGFGVYRQQFNALGQPMVHTIVGSDQNDTFRLADTATNLHLQGGAGNDTYVINASTQITELADQGIDNVISSQSYTLGANLENLSLTGSAHLNATGNAQNNIILGNSGNNILTGLDGDDVIRAGLGRDQLFGGAGNDELDGGADGDLMVGGTGDDVYVRNNSGDVITELAGEGIDTVKSSIHYIMGSNIENVILTGTNASNAHGNALDNQMTGNDMNNILLGRAGHDTIMAGGGNDTLDGEDGDDRLFGESGDDVIAGGAGNDLLDGGIGIDQMTGGAGNDTYVRNNTGDVIVELTNEGVDTVQSSIHYTLDANIENAQLIGNTAINARGNELDNILTGNDQSNQLDGRAGNDTLIGGKGADTYLMTRSGQSDLIIDQDSTVNTHDVLQFTGAVSQEQLWFSRQGDNLVVTIIGTTDQATIQDWYSDKANRIEIFASGNGRYLSAIHVQNLVDAMANLALPPLGETSLRGAYRTQLLGVINANWSTEYPDVTPPDAPTVRLLDDTGISAIDAISSKGVLQVVAEAGALVEYSSDNLTWSTTAPAAVEGSNTVYVRQTDTYHNVGAVQRFDFVIDTTAPTTAPMVALAQDTGSSSTDGVTSVAQLTVTGLDADGTAQYSIDGETWSASVPTLADGSHTLYVRQVDVAGNPSPATTISFVLDTTALAPMLALAFDSGASDTDLISNQAALSVTDTEQGALIEYSTDGSTWSTTAPAAQEGSNTVYVRQTDVAGNISAAQQISFTLDTSNPAAPQVSLSQDNGISSTDLITSMAGLTITGTESNAVVEYSTDGNTWSVNAPTASEGSNTVYVRQVDVAGNASAATSFTFVLDTQSKAPNVQLSNDTGASNTDLITKVAGLTVTGEDGALIEYSSDNQTWSTTAPAAVEGSNTVYVRQTDAAGNLSAATSLTFVLDTQVDTPTATLQDSGRFDDDGLTNNSVLLIADTESGATIEYSSDNLTWSTTAPTPVQGANTFWVRQVDVAGNTSASTSVSFTFDSIAPNALRLELDDDTGLSTSDNISSNGTLLIRGLANDVELEYSIDGINWDPSTPIPQEGENSIWIRQVDRAGNASVAQTIVFTLDTTAPVAPVITLSQDTGNSATDLLTNLAVLSLADVEVGALVEYSTDNGDTWSTTAPTAVEGSNTVWVRQTDVAGNVSTESTITFVLDSQIADLTISLDQDTGDSSTDHITANGSYSIAGVEDGALVEYSTDGNIWSTTAPVAVEGSNQIWVRQTDAAGNVSVPQQLSFTLDTQVAAVGVALAQDSGNSSTDLITNIGTLSLTNVEAGALVEYSTDNGNTWSDLAPTAVEGLNTIYVRQTDVAGNISTPTQLSFTLDTTLLTPKLSLNTDSGVSNTDLISNLGSYSVSGIEADALVEYSLDGNVWSTTAPTAVEGLNTIHVRQTDTAGNVASSSLSFTLDTQVVKPTVALAQDNGRSSTDRITNVSTLSVTGTEAGALIEYSSNGTTWSTTQPTATQGSNTVHVRQTDTAGNVSAAQTITFTFDSVAPAQPRIQLDNDTGISSTDLISSNGTLLIRGLAADVQLQYSTDNSNWSLNSVTPVEGLNTIWVRQVDRAGNASPSQSITFTLDTSAAAPIVSLSNDTGLSGNDRITSDATLNIKVETGALIEYSTDGNTWSTGVPMAAAGLNTVYVRQTDVAGNVSAATSFSFTLDLSTPVEPTIALTNDSGLNTADFVTNDGRLTVQTEAGALVEYSLDGNTWSTTQPTAVEGLNTIQVRQTDTAGNVSAAQQITFTLDTQTPDALVVGLNNDSGNSNADAITSDASFFINGTEQGALVEYSTNGGSTWSATAPTPVEGNNTILLRQTDIAGNISNSTTLSFVLDTTALAPKVLLKQDTGLSSSDLITQMGALVVIGETGALIEYSTDNVDWSTTAPTAVEGNNTVYVRQTDVAGNVSPAQQIDFVVDTQSPVAPTIDLSFENDTGFSSSDYITSNSNFSVSGVEDGALVEYSTDNGDTWSSTAPTPVQGENTILVRQTDVAGNLSGHTSLTFVFDTIANAPTVALTDDSGASNTDLLTNNGSLTVSATEDGALIEYSLDNINWSDMQPKYAQGSNTVYVRQTDVAGNISPSQAITFNFDTLVDAPTLSLEEDTGDFDNDLITRNPQINVANLEAGGTWAYQIDGTGDWFEGTGTSFDAIDGEHSYVVRQTDAAGNVQDSASFAVNAILIPAAISAQMVDSNDQVVENGATSDPNAVLRLSGDATDTWQYRFVSPTNLDAQWQDVTGDTDLSLMEGSYNVETRKIDIAGNFVSALNRVSIDTTAATPIMTLVADTGVNGDGITTNPFVTVSGVEGNAIWEVRVDDSPFWNQTTLSSFEYKLLVGTHTYHIRQIDKAGNVSAEGTYTFTYQSEVEQPKVTLLQDSGLSNSDFITSIGFVNVGLLPEATAWQYSIDDGEWIDGFGASFEMLADGQAHNYAVRQQADGRWSEPTTIYGVQLDNTAPADFSVELDLDSGASNSDGITNQGTLNVAGLEVGARLQYRVDGGEWRGVDVTSPEQTLDLLEGTHSYDLQLIDVAGNASNIISRSYTYINADLAAPTLVLAEDTASLSDNISSNGQINVTLSVTGTGVTWQYDVDGSGQWIDGTGASFNALDGEHSYRVRQIDVAGNISPASTPLVVHWDADAPVFSSGLTARVRDNDSEGQQLIPTTQVVYTATATDDTAFSYSIGDSDVFNIDRLTGALTFKQPVGYLLGGNNSYSTVITATDAAGNSRSQTVTIQVDRNNLSTPSIELAESLTGSFVQTIAPQSTQIQPDGKVLALFDAGVNNPKQIVRYNSDGSLDNSFNTIQFSAQNSANQLVIFGSFTVDSTGRIYTITYGESASNSSNKEFVVSRFSSTGQADNSWGGTGKITTIAPSANGFVGNGTILNDGSYFVEKSASVNNTQSTEFLRFNSSGLVSSTTLALTSDGSQQLDWSTSLVDPTGQFVYVAFTGLGNYQGLGVAKYRLSNNTLDTSYGTSGVLKLVNSAQNPSFVEVDSQGRVLVGYQKFVTSTNFDTVIYRLLANGTIDSSFGSSGITTLNNADNTSSLIIATDGSMYVLSGNTLTHLLTNGTRDPNFGTNGQVTIGESQEYGNTFAQYPYSIKQLGNLIQITAPSKTINNEAATVIAQFDATGKPISTFGDVQLTITEGNRPIGLLNSQASIIDADAASTSYDGVSVVIARNTGADASDVFGTRGKLSFSEGKIIWDGIEVGTVSNSAGRLELIFNVAASHEVFDGVTRAITFSNTSQQPTAKLQLLWTVNDNDPADARSATKVQTINIQDDYRDVGDTLILTSNNGANLRLKDMIVVDGKTYYLQEFSTSSAPVATRFTRNNLDQFINNGQDTTVNARTYTQADGTQYKMLTIAEIDALLAHPTVASNTSWVNRLFTPLRNGIESLSGVSAADLVSANTHLWKESAQAQPSQSSDLGGSYARPRFALIEVTPATQDTAVLQPQLRLAEDNGSNNSDFITSNGLINILGLERSLPIRYSINGGETWQVIAANTNPVFELPEGVYLTDRIIVEQTDLGGFVTQIKNTTSYNIDKTIESLRLFNDQGLSATDLTTADGRVLIVGFDNAQPFEYRVNGGNWQAGGMINATDYGFTLAAGSYAAGAIEVRQTIATFTTFASNGATYVVSPTLRQGELTLKADIGVSFTDRLTADGTFSATGFEANTAWEYSTNGGASWQQGTGNGTTKSFVVTDGSYAAGQIQIRQTDSKGFLVQFNSSESYVVDSTIATPSVELLNDTGFSNTDLLTADGRVRFNITGTLEAGDVWEYSLNAGQTWVKGTGNSLDVTLANGSYNAEQIRVRVTDNAGNVSTDSFSKKVVVDNTDDAAPVFTGSTSGFVVDKDGTGTANTVSNTTTLLTVQTTDANAVYYSLSGAQADLFNINSNGQITFKAATNQINPDVDRYDLTVHAVDAFNNANSQEVSVGIAPQFVRTGSSQEPYSRLSSDRYELTFSHDIVINPNAVIPVSAEYGGFAPFNLNVNDPTQVQVVGNKLIIFTNGFNAQGYYRFNLDGLIRSKLTNELFVKPKSWEQFGFELDKSVSYDTGFSGEDLISATGSFSVASLDGAAGTGAVSIVGDVNGDGIDDWAVSYANGDSLGRSDNGKTYVVYGRTDGVQPNLTDVANGQGGYLISGRASGDLAGARVSAAGDVNGDGFDDILVHATGANGGLGKGYVVYGAANRSNLDLGVLEGNSALGRVYTNNISDSFGAVGDTNGDGYDDVAHGRGDLNRVTVLDEVQVSKVTNVREGKIVVKADWLSFAADWIDTAMKINDFIDDPLAGSIELVAELPDRVEQVMGADGDLTPVEEAMADQLRQVIRELQPNQRLVDYSFTQTGGSGGGMFSIPKDTVYNIKYTIESTIKTIYRTTTTLYGAGEAVVELGGANGYSGSRNVTGTINAQRIGADVSALGDINGDGRADFGVLDGGSGGVLAQLNVVLGGNNNTEQRVYQQSGQPDWRLPHQ
jgi:uncharacterized delta-60 repeat protein